MSNHVASSRWRWLASLPLMLVSCAESRWPNVPFTEVRAYIFNLDEWTESEAGRVHNSIVVDGKLDSTVVDPDGIRLSVDQINHLEWVIHSAPPSDWTAFCFTPRHAFVFYDDQHRPVAWLNICFECHKVQAEPELPQALDVCYLRHLCLELDLPVFDESERYLEVLQQPTPEIDAAGR